MKTRKRHLLLVLIMLLVVAFALPAQAKAAPKLTKSSVSLYVGKKTTLKIKNKSGKVTFKSANKKIATVSKKGVVQAKKAGKTKIYVYVGKKKLTCKVTVKKALIVSQSQIVINRVGESAKINVDFKPYGTVYFKVSDTSMISGEWGRPEGFPDYLEVTAYAVGTSYVTFTNDYNKETYKVKVICKNPAATVDNKPHFEAEIMSVTRNFENHWVKIRIANDGNSDMLIGTSVFVGLYYPYGRSYHTTMFLSTNKSWGTNQFTLSPGYYRDVMVYLDSAEEVTRSSEFIFIFEYKGTQYFATATYDGDVTYSLY